MTKSVFKYRIYVDLFNRYVVFASKRRMSDFHTYMMYLCGEILNKSKPFHRLGGSVSFVAVRDLNDDNRLPDIYTPFFDIECETGLKYHYDDLIQRILSTQKTVIVVLPNEHSKQRYLKNVSVRKQHLKICTLGEFSSVVSDILKNVKALK